MQYRGNISSRFSSNSSELIKILEEFVPLLLIEDVDHEQMF